MKVLCFRVFGDYAHFKPYYTTTSKTTYTLMPPTAIYGLLGAILGYGREEYYSLLLSYKTRVGIGLEQAVRKVSMSTNLINTKGDYWVPTSKNSNGPRTPTRYEFVVNPSYVVYVTMDHLEILDQLAERIRNHCPCYMPCLGLAGLLADIEMEFYEDCVQISDEGSFLELDSAVAVDKLVASNSIDIVNGASYCKEQYVKTFRENRIPSEYVDVLFTTNNKKIAVRVLEAYQNSAKSSFAFLNNFQPQD